MSGNDAALATIQKLQGGAAVEEGEASALLDAIESASTPLAPVARMKAVQHIGAACAPHELLIAKCFKTLLNEISAQGNTADTFAIHSLTTVCSGETKKQAETVREAADLFMQILVESSGFTATAKAAAKEGLEKLVGYSFGAVVKKCAQLMSVQREDDAPEYVADERLVVMEQLDRLTAESFKDKWEEDWDNTSKLLGLALADLNSKEFSRFSHIVAKIPKVKEDPKLLIAIAFGAKPHWDKPQEWERINALGASLAKCTDCPTLLEGMIGRVGKVSDDEESCLYVRALHLAARISNEEAAGKAIPAVKDAILANIENANYTVVEALLLVLSVLGHKAGAEMLPVISDEAFQVPMKALSEKIDDTHKKVVYQVKKLMASGSASAKHAAMIDCLANIRDVAGAFASKKNATSPQASWYGAHRLPKVAGQGNRRGGGATKRAAKEPAKK